MFYTLMAYKPDNNDVCRGHVMAHYSSDFQWITTESKQELIERYAKLLVDEDSFDGRESRYEFTLLIDGNDPDYLWPDQAKTIKSSARREADTQIELKRQATDKEEAETKQAILAIKEQQEREQLVKLKEKYEVVQ